MTIRHLTCRRLPRRCCPPGMTSAGNQDVPLDVPLQEPSREAHRERSGQSRIDAVAAIVEPTGGAWRTKLSDWLGRYGLAECTGVACALLTSLIIRRLTGNNVAAAYGGAWGESLGYAGAILLRDYRAVLRAANGAGRSFAAGDARGVATGFVTEFGPAALFDTVVIRPFTMAVGMRLFGPGRGLIAGKLAADVCFYVPVIFLYERRKRRTRAAITRP